MTSIALNAICPYYTMYPLDFPVRVLKRLGRPGDWVIDPFCGRGTTNFAARILGMPSVGLDSSPVAVAIAKAKLAFADAPGVLAEAQTILESAKSSIAVPTGEFWKLAFHEHTLVRLCQLRQALIEECSSNSRIVLRAIILGALHGPRSKKKPSYFSNQSPRTFAPKPGYAVKFWKQRRMTPDQVDPLDLIMSKAERYLKQRLPNVDGFVRLADSREPNTFGGIPEAKFVVTSPPYYGMRTYLPDQWLRLWFLGGADHVEYRQSNGQLEHTGADHFASGMRGVWRNVHQQTTKCARLVIRFGGIHNRKEQPMGILKASLDASGWKVMTAREIPDCDHGKRQARQFQASPKKSVAEYDVYCRKA